MENAESTNRPVWNGLIPRTSGFLRTKKFGRRFAPELVVLAIYVTYVVAQSFSQASRFAVEDAGYTHFVELAGVAVGVISLTLLAAWLRTLAAICRRAGAAITVLALFGYAALCFYNWKTNSALTFSLLADHFRELQCQEAWIVASDQLSAGNYFALAGGYAGLWALEWKMAAFSQALVMPKRSLLVTCSFGVAWLVTVVWGPVTLEPVTLLARSALGESFRLQQHGLTVSAENLPEFPYAQERGSNTAAIRPPAGRPHVFVLMIESFNARFVTGRAEDGSPLMPRFQDAIRKGVWVEPFYGNTTYTIKGQEAALTSLPPALSGNLANGYEKVRIHALPTILREEGYDTVFFQAHKNLEFAGTGEFMRRCGFETVQAMDRELTKTMDPALFWNWGVRDDAFFDRFFAWLPDRNPQPTTPRRSDVPKPVFAVLATISSHSPYDELPRYLCEAFPNPTSKAEWYANVMRQVDRGIGRFLDDLEHSVYGSNAIVVITGDHSIPMDEHGTSSLQSGFFEESFRIPCLILWPGKLEPRRLENEPFSQVDLAPTLLDLCGISAPNHFTGRSIFQPTTGPRTAVMVQPYDGLYLVAREASWKYVFHNATGREFIFDLARDPDERLNRFWESPPELRSRLRQEVGRLWLHDHLLARNRIWPVASNRQIHDGTTAARPVKP